MSTMADIWPLPGYGRLFPGMADRGIGHCPCGCFNCEREDCEDSVGYPQIPHRTFNPESLNPPCGGKRICFFF